MTTVANDRFLFIHIPKTGGTWVAEAMAHAGVKYEPLREPPHPTLDELPESPFRFAFVRRPVTWYASLWRFHRRYRQTWNGLSDYIDLDLPDFLTNVARHHPGYLTDYYTRFVGEQDAIDYVGRYENLVDDLVAALELAGQDFDHARLRSFPARNYSGEREHYGALEPPEHQDHIPAHVRAMVEEAEAQIEERYYGKFRAGSIGTAAAWGLLGRNQAEISDSRET